MPFVEKLREGYELVMGNRFKGGIAKGAMPPLHRYLGNPMLSFIGKMFYKANFNDFYCGLRGFQKEAIVQLQLQSPGMVFAHEMAVKSCLSKLKTTEVPTTLSPDGRVQHPPHLRTFSDGWMTLKFLLIHSPNWLFMYPGIFLLLIGILLSARLSIGELQVGTILFSANTLLYTTALIFIGLQLLFFSIESKLMSINIGIHPKTESTMKSINFLSIERGSIIGLILILAGIVASIYAVNFWDSIGFGPINGYEYENVLRITIPAMAGIVCGTQIIFNSFYLSSVMTFSNRK
jgi:hypothetical protein